MTVTTPLWRRTLSLLVGPARTEPVTDWARYRQAYRLHQRVIAILLGVELPWPSSAGPELGSSRQQGSLPEPAVVHPGGLAFQQIRLLNLIRQRSDLEYELMIIDNAMVNLANTVASVTSLTEAEDVSPDVKQQVRARLLELQSARDSLLAHRGRRTEILGDLRRAEDNRARIVEIIGQIIQRSFGSVADAEGPASQIEQELAELLRDSEVIERRIEQERSMLDAELNDLLQNLANL